MYRAAKIQNLIVGCGFIVRVSHAMKHLLLCAGIPIFLFSKPGNHSHLQSKQIGINTDSSTDR